MNTFGNNTYSNIDGIISKETSVARLNLKEEHQNRYLNIESSHSDSSASE